MTTDECMSVLTGLERQLAKEVGAGANKTIEVEFASHHGEPVVNSYKVSGPRSALPASISAAANLALFGEELEASEPVILSADVVEPAQATATGAAATNPETTEPKESLILKPEIKSVEPEVKATTKNKSATSAVVSANGANAALIDVHTNNGVLVTTSRNIAVVFGKEHRNVVRDIRAVIDANPDKNFTGLNFELSSYTDPTGRKLPEYQLTRDGTMLLIMGYTGPKAMALKTAYIKRFNEMEQALRNGTQVQRQQVSYTPRELLDAAQLIYQSAGLEGNQLTLALDKANTAITGKSLLALGDVQLIAPTQERLLNPTELGKSLGLGPRAVNSRLQSKGYQIKGVAGWELTEKGKALGGVYLDTGKKHSSGAPVRQIKWPSGLSL